VQQPAITLRDAYRFFLPLVFMTELNMISKSVIHAFLARTLSPSTSLAAFNTSFTFYYTLTSATEVTTYLAISYLRDRRCVRRLLAFLCLVLAAPFIVAQLVAFTAFGDWLYGGVFGVSTEAVRQAKLATFLFSLSAPVLLFRGIAFALLMVNRRTIFITWSTFVRLVSLGGSLLALPLLFSGAAIGAAALVACMFCETAFAWLFAWRHFKALPRDAGDVPEYGTLWSFAWPLATNQASEMGVVFVVNLFLGRLANAELALAAFGVVHGLVSLLFSPMRNLLQTAQTLVASRADARVLLVFTLQLAAIFAAVALVLFHTPLERWVLDTIMGLTPELSAYCAPAMKLAFLMAIFWALAAYCRGLLAGARSTTLLAFTGALRVGTVAAVGALSLAVAGINGAVLGLAAWVLAYAMETAVLGWRLRRPGGTLLIY
jgi:Na+-driven multidrug efflux pump